MNEELVAALARAVGLPLPPERVAELSESLDAQIAAGGGAAADAVEGVEPAIVLEPRWDR